MPNPNFIFLCMRRRRTLERGGDGRGGEVIRRVVVLSSGRGKSGVVLVFVFWGVFERGARAGTEFV